MVSQLKKEQQRELDAFNSNMKQEQSELKKQVAAQFNDRKSRQTTLKNRKTQLDQHQKYKESAFRSVKLSVFDVFWLSESSKTHHLIMLGVSTPENLL